MKNGYILRNCPCCNAEPPSHPEVASVVTAEDSRFEDLILQWNGFYKDKSIFSYVRCNDCGLLYAPIFFSGEQLSKLYAQMPPNMEEVPVSALRKTQTGYFNKLRCNSNLQGSFVEIGPDVGYFAENCVKDGRFDEYWLLEPNIDVKAQLQSVVGSKDHHIISEMDGIQQVPEKSANAIVMIHVLDHLLDPRTELLKISKKIRPDGTLLIVTHDESSILRKLTQVKWPAFCLQHPQIYNPESIAKLLKSSGFQTVEIAKTKNYFELGFLVKHALWLLGIKINKIPPWLKIPVGLKLGNIVTVAKLNPGVHID